MQPSVVSTVALLTQNSSFDCVTNEDLRRMDIEEIHNDNQREVRETPLMQQSRGSFKLSSLTISAAWFLNWSKREVR